MRLGIQGVVGCRNQASLGACELNVRGRVSAEDLASLTNNFRSALSIFALKNKHIETEFGLVRATYL